MRSCPAQLISVSVPTLFPFSRFPLSPLACATFYFVSSFLSLSLSFHSRCTHAESNIITVRDRMQDNGEYSVEEKEKKKKKTRNDRGISRRMKVLFCVVGSLPLQSAKVVGKGRWNGMKMPLQGEPLQVDAYFVVSGLVVSRARWRKSIVKANRMDVLQTQRVTLGISKTFVGRTRRCRPENLENLENRRFVNLVECDEVFRTAGGCHVTNTYSIARAMGQFV